MNDFDKWETELAACSHGRSYYCEGYRKAAKRLATGQES